MSVPKPRDPNAPSITPGELADELTHVFAQPATDLEMEAGQLERAHQILQRGLQEN
ncbi:hypothetical protein [Corynebacterium pseudodiphtheriticum]|uniref:hypothetical protein n=1 Tax=Corynebacterium pseudodiphtheriticum TaxID=37637 RepID=UPI0025417765|nr:hypothetical protein [Corynebacterium pseudodiphtheriticum]MDK4274035.1 hypothetical protein [Corynebacterium pseudodiphtheriticum]